MEEQNQQNFNSTLQLEGTTDLNFVEMFFRLVDTYLRPYWKIYLGSAFLFLLAAVVYVNSVTPIYRVACQLYIGNRESNITNIHGIQDPTFSRDDAFIATQSLIIRSKEIVNKAKEICGSSASGVSGPFVRQIQGTLLVEIAMTSANEDAAVRMSNTLADVYISSTQLRKTKISQAGIEMMRSQLEDFRRTLEEAKNDLLQFKKENGIYNLKDNYQTLVSQLNELNSQNLQCVTRERELEIALEEIKEHREKAAQLMPFLSPESTNNSQLAALKMMRINHEMKLPELLGKYTTSSPVIKAHEKVSGMINKAAEEEVEINIAGLTLLYQRNQRRSESLKQQMEELKAELARLDRLSGDYSIRQASCDSIEASYKQLATRINELNIANAQNSMDSTSIFVVQPAVASHYPFYPRKMRCCAMAVLFGLGLAAAIAFILATLNNKVMDIENFKAAFGDELSVFGSIPSFDQSEDELIREDGESAIADVFRNIRISMNLSSSCHNAKMLLISSTLPREGKTFTAFNLAKSFALAHNRVLLMDMDLRKPRVHKLLADFLPADVNSCGLSNVLVGDKEIGDIIHHLDAFNLDVITSGPVSSNPNELLDMSRLAEILDQVKEQYDLVIIDTPPILGTADALVIQRLQIPIILVVRLFALPMAALRDLKERLANINVNLSGLIVNNVDLQKNAFGYYGGSYYGAKRGYGYMYGYGYRKHKHEAVQNHNVDQNNENNENDAKN